MRGRLSGRLIHPRKDEKDFEAATQLYIDPDVCINAATASRLPGDRDLHGETIPEKWKQYQQINADWYKNRQA